MPSLTLEQKVGQLLMCGFDAKVADTHITEMIRDYHIGGVIVFKRNIESPGQLKALHTELQKINYPANPLPLMIAIDQEGGTVARIDSGITYLPGAMALAATQEKEATEQIYTAVGKELRALGVHIDFAPVADVNNNPHNPVIGVRSFGETSEAVIEFMLPAMEGLKKANVVPVVKHFPGHGDTVVDSHVGLPRVEHDREHLQRVELAPFKAAIDAGVPAIMSAHVIMPAIEPDEIPCTLSPRVLTGILREELGFSGVIFTDCLEMNAIASYYGVVEGAVRAFEAGADVILISHTKQHQMDFIKAMLEHVANGRISEARIDESVARIVALKERYKMQEAIDSPLRETDAVALGQRLSQASITLVSDKQQLLPLQKKAKTLVVTARVGVQTEIEALMSLKNTLGHYLRAEIPECNEIFIRANTTPEEREAVCERAAGYEQIVVMSYNAIFFPEQSALINTLAEQCERLVVVAGRLPYDLKNLDQVSTYLAAYENRAEAMRSTANVLLGKNKATGQLPVTL